MPVRTFEDKTEEIIGGAIEVHRQLGTGLLESVYEACLAIELEERGLHVDRQVAQPVIYRGIRLNAGFRIDLLVEEQVIVELKAVDRLMAIHEAQLLTYLKLTGVHVGLLMNFHARALRDGLRRMVL